MATACSQGQQALSGTVSCSGTDSCSGAADRDKLQAQRAFSQAVAAWSQYYTCTFTSPRRSAANLSQAGNVCSPTVMQICKPYIQALAMLDALSILLLHLWHNKKCFAGLGLLPAGSGWGLTQNRKCLSQICLMANY